MKIAFKIVVILFAFGLYNSYAQNRERKPKAARQEKSKDKDINLPPGPLGKELERRMKLDKLRSEGKLTTEEFDLAIYGPIAEACKSSINDVNKMQDRLHRLRDRQKTDANRKKVDGLLRLYKDYQDILKKIVEVIEKEKNYGLLEPEIFPKMVDVEKKLARLSGNKENRSWFTVAELFAPFGKKVSSNNNDDEDETEENETEEKVKKAKTRKTNK